MAHLLHCRPPLSLPGDQGGSGHHGRLGPAVASQRCPPCLPGGLRERRPGVRPLRRCLSAQGRTGACRKGWSLDGPGPSHPHQLPDGAAGRCSVSAVSVRVLEFWGRKWCLRAGASAVSGSWAAGQLGLGLCLAGQRRTSPLASGTLSLGSQLRLSFRHRRFCLRTLPGIFNVQRPPDVLQSRGLAVVSPPVTSAPAGSHGISRLC